MSRCVKLEGRSKKGRERIKQFGEWWTVDARMVGTVPRLNYLLVRTPETWRWIFETGDRDFNIVAERESGDDTRD